MPSLSPYLQRRGFALNFRITVPHDLRSIVGARELSRALPTTDRGSAALLALRCAVIARQVFAELRALQCDMKFDEEKGRALMREARWRMRSIEQEKQHLFEIADIEAKHRREIERVRLETENAVYRRVLGNDQVMLAAPFAPSGVRQAASIAFSPAADSGPGTAMPSSSDTTWQAARAPSTTKAAGSASSNSSPTLGSLIKTFLDKYPEKKGSMLTKHKLVLPLFLEVVGDKPVSSIKQADVNRFFDTVLNLPPQWSAECRKRGISALALAAQSHAVTLGPKSFDDTYKACVRQFLKKARLSWQDEGFPVTLTTEGIEYSGEREEGENRQRAFHDDELKRLFHGPEMAAFRADPKLQHQFWLPFVGLYTGARVNEICQLNPQFDVLQDAASGIWHFKFTEETEGDERIEKSIKNKVSARLVPIHSHLIEIGFLDYAERIKASGAKLLFPMFQPSVGRASPQGEKWFRNFLRELGLRDETPHARLVGMHAFRSAILAKAHNANPPLDVTSITGHAATASDVVAGYQGRLWLENQQRILEAVPFGVREATGDHE
jgi:integrase